MGFECTAASDWFDVAGVLSSGSCRTSIDEAIVGSRGRDCEDVDSGAGKPLVILVRGCNQLGEALKI